MPPEVLLLWGLLCCALHMFLRVCCPSNLFPVLVFSKFRNYLTYYYIFPTLMSKWFRVTVYIVSTLFECLYLFADMVFMSKTILYAEIFAMLTAAFLLISLLIRLRRPNVEQSITIAGIGIILLATIHDSLFYNNIRLPFSNAAIPETALVIFFLFQMTAIFYSTMREVMAVKELEQRSRMEVESLKSLNTMKEAFLGELSHELKMPITVISGFSQYTQELLGDKALDRAELYDSARRVELEAERMDQMVEQLLDLAVIETGNFSQIRDRLCVKELFDQIHGTHFPMLNKGNNRLIVRLEPELYVYADRERILQILLNLLSNACKYTKTGEITLCAEKKSDNVVQFSVADTGAGIASEDIPSLFDRYSKVRSGPQSATSHGLGLYICKKLVESHGGEIRVESELGMGTVVRFTILSNEGEDNVK